MSSLTHPGPSSTSHTLPSPGPSHALCPPLLTLTSLAGNTTSGFPSHLQVPVNKVVQRGWLLRSHLPNPHPAKFRPRLSQGAGGHQRRAPRPCGAAPSAFQAQGAVESFRCIGTFPSARGWAPLLKVAPGKPASLLRAHTTLHGHPRPALEATRGWPQIFSPPSRAPPPSIMDTPFTISP